MKITNVTTIGLALIYSSFMLISCGGEMQEHSHNGADHTHEHGEDHDHNHQDDHDHEDGHVHDHDHDNDESGYKIDFHSEPQQLVAGGSAILSFTPTKEGNENALVPLDIHHEKKMHLMILSTDLSYFEHIHPKYNGKEYEIKAIGSDESFSKERGLDETEFLQGGDYIMFVDYVPAGTSGSLDKIPLTVSGTPRKSIPLGDQSLIWENDGYHVELSMEKELTMNTPTELKIHITENGKPVTDLDKYLGALAHMVVLSEDTEEYLHVHPMQSSTDGPDVILHTNFPKAGKYKVFMQFNHKGLVRTTNFVVQVDKQD
ncbi:MAG: hypothetical protein IH946_02125 [Bacteroidetes bacterium]|nr:hypothetical protein [Bacteroidota bacterium]